MKGRLSDNVVMPMTIVNPPPVQEMKPNDDNHDSAQSSANNEHTTLEMQALQTHMCLYRVNACVDTE